MNSKAINIFSFTIIKVQKNEISEQEVNNIRAKASKQMYEYNFDTMLWLWSSIGLYDVSLQYEQHITKENLEIFINEPLTLTHAQKRQRAEGYKNPCFQGVLKVMSIIFLSDT